MYKQTLEKYNSIRKAAEALGITKSKFMVLYKKELGLCTATTGCKNPCKFGRTRCVDHLKYASSTQDPIRKKITNNKWSSENKEYKSECYKKYQKDNVSKINAYNRKYSASEKGRIVNTAKSAYRRAMKKCATPSWVNIEDLKEVYAKRPKGSHVDHIIPLCNDNVCGLHVPWNLQYLIGHDNDSKGYSFDGTYDNNGWRHKD